MRSHIMTYFGPLDLDVARATRQAVAAVAIPALVVLDDVHLRLGIAYTSTGEVPMSERPTCRWAQQLNALFRIPPPVVLDILGEQEPRPVWSPDRRRVRRLITNADEPARKALRNLLLYPALFLMGEEHRMRDNIELAAMVHPRNPRPLALLPTDAGEELWTVGTSVRRLLDAVEDDQVCELVMRPPRLDRGRVRVAWAR